MPCALWARESGRAQGRFRVVSQLRRLLRLLFDRSARAPVALRVPEADSAAPYRRRLVPQGLSRLDRVAEGNGLRGADSHGFEAEVIFHDEDHLFSAGAKTWMKYHLKHFHAPRTYPLCCGTAGHFSGLSVVVGNARYMVRRKRVFPKFSLSGEDDLSCRFSIVAPLPANRTRRSFP